MHIINSIRELNDRFRRKRFSSDEFAMADTVTYDALVKLNVNSSGSAIPLLELFPEAEGSFKRLRRLMMLTPDEREIVLGDLARPLERAFRKPLVKQPPAVNPRRLTPCIKSGLIVVDSKCTIQYNICH